jgi:hypothetical protein
MGQIMVEGLGIVEIEEDTPNDAESDAIAAAIGGAENEGDPTITANEAPRGIRPPPEQGFDNPDIQLPPIREVIEGKTTGQQTQKEKTRGAIEDAPGLVQLVAEMTPSVTGAVAGGTIATALLPRQAPVSTAIGTIIGGFGGEFIGQKSGISPESDLNLVLSGAGPMLGVAAGSTIKLGKAALGLATRKLPFTRTALAQINLRNAVPEFESLGTKILTSPRGLVKPTGSGAFEPIPGSEIYKAVRDAGVLVDASELRGTLTALSEVQQQLAKTKAFPKVKQAVNALKAVSASLQGPNLSMDDLVATRQLIGEISKLSKGGVKEGASKKIFGAIAADMDRMASRPGLTKRAARLAKQAAKRAKLEFSVKELEAGVARFIKPVEDGFEFNVKGMQKWLNDVSNPKSKQFNKNFSEALKDDLPQIKERLAELAKLGRAGQSPGGPGSIVMRGRFAAIGALIGGFAGGGIGAGAGALAGAAAPEMIVGALVTTRASNFLLKAAKAGEGAINIRAWAALGEILVRSMGERPQGQDKTFIGSDEAPVQ